MRRGWAGACLSVVVLVGCQRVGVAPPAPPSGTPPSRAACSSVSLEARGWTLVQDSAGVSFRVPPDFVERSHTDLYFREWIAAGEPSGSVSIGFSPSREHWLTIRRVPSPGMHEMSECVADSGDRQILLQAWRTEGGIFRQGRRFDNYEVFALVPVEPLLTLFVTGGGDDPRFQDVVIAIARTVRVEDAR